jgi:multidrug efflux pump subunit AcrA (membrane-fusion protein)
MKKKIIIFAVAFFLLFSAIYQGFFKKEDFACESSKVAIGTVVKEVTETGQVAKGEKINLSYKTGGRIEGVYANVGQEVEKGTVLAKLDATALAIQLREAESSLALYQAELEKLVSGPTQLEIQKAETLVSNARSSAESAQIALDDITQQAEESLSSAYEDALNTLQDAYLKAYNAWNAADFVKKTYFTKNDQQGIRVAEEVGNMNAAVSEMEESLEEAKSSLEDEKTEEALSEAQISLSAVYDSLSEIREICEEINYKDSVSSTDKSSLDTHKGYINTALSSVVNARQTIALTKTANSYNINQAKASLLTAQGSLESAQDNLSILISPPRKEDVSLYQAQVSRAEAQVSLLKEQINDAYLVSPVKGEVAQIEKRAGENISSGELLAVIIPAVSFEVKLDLYEEDVVKVSPGNEAEISLVAFSEDVFKGEVSIVDPAEKMKDGIVYYEAKISFKEVPDGIKPGMTADVVIKTDSRESVLVVPEDALIEREDKFFVQALENGAVSEKEVEIGLIGTNDLAEVLSGLKEGEEVVLQ